MQQQQANAQQQPAQQSQHSKVSTAKSAQQSQQQIYAAVESNEFPAQANNTTAPHAQNENDGVSTSVQEQVMQIMNNLDKEVEK
eukprot:15324965-Ditylum_brightwellii.AAC.1